MVVPAEALKTCRVVEPRFNICPVVVAPPKIVRPVAVVLLPIVVEAVETKPPENNIPVEVAWYPSACLVNGQAKVIEEVGQAVLQSLDMQRIVVEAYCEEKRVEVALVNVCSAVQSLA